MLDFSPKTSFVWQSAAFSLLYSSVVGIFLRGSLLICLFLGFVLLTENQAFSWLSGSLFILVAMFELYYRLKICSQGVVNQPISVNTNLADLVTFNLAQRLLAWPFWKSSAHLLKAIHNDPIVKFTFNKSGIGREELLLISQKDEEIKFNEVLQLAASFAEKDGRTKIDESNLLQALFSQSPFLQKLFFEKNLKQKDLDNIIHWAKNAFPQSTRAFWERPTSTLGLGMATIWSGGWTLETEHFTQDISFIPNKSKFLVGRAQEITQLEEILLRGEKRNAILVGEPGVGKEAIVYSLAKGSASGLLPQGLQYKRFLELDLTSLGAEKNPEEVLKNILAETTHAGDVILFVPDIENLAGALESGKFDFSGLLLEYLKTDLQVIGTTLRPAYHEFIESKSSFAANFEIINIAEPNAETAIRILEEAAVKIERHNQLTITYSALQKTIELSNRYLVDKVLPGKAIELLDESAARVVLSKKSAVLDSDIEEMVTAKTNIPTNLAGENEKTSLLELEKTLHQRIVGQEEAVTSLSQAVRRSRTLKKTSQRPIGVFLFLGPTGVGKTETAKALASVYYGGEERIIRLDMSEYNQENSLYRLIGAPPGSADYRSGGQLTEAVRANPFSLVLLDELEKAHPKVQEVFLAIFDEGVTTDSSGRKISFANTIIVGTSNAGSEYIREEILKKPPNDTFKKSLLEKLLQEATFKPEFLNRFDEVVIFKPLSESQVSEVIKIMLKNLTVRLEKQDLTVRFTPEVINYLSQKGYDPTFGARPLQRTIQKEIEDRISDALLTGKLDRGATASFVITNDQITLE